MKEEVLTRTGGTALLLMLTGTLLSGLFVLAPQSASLTALWIGILATSLIGVLMGTGVATVYLARICYARFGDESGRGNSSGV